MHQGKSAEAAAPCHTAIQRAAGLSPTDGALAQQRGALISGAADNREAFSLAAIVSDNIARTYGARLVDDMREEVAAAW